MMRFLLLLTVWVPMITAWDVDDRCLRRLRGRDLETSEADFLFEEPNPEWDEDSNNEEPVRLLTERELSSDLRFNLKIHWKEGYCWQEEWRERKWCLECDGDVCSENDKLEVQECKNVDRQEFNWISTRGGGRLKVSKKNLCFERVSTDKYRLKPCSSSSKQILQGFRENRPFELHPRDDDDKCFTQEHHPKAGEEIFTTWCKTPRKSHTNEWEVYWPSD